MTDEILDYERATRRSRRIRMSLLGLVVASPFLWLTWRCHENSAQRERWEEESRAANALTAPELTELRRLLTDARARIQAGTKAFPTDVTPAKLDVIEPGDAPCPFRIEGVDPSYGTYGAYDASPSGSVAPGAQPTAASLASDAATLTELDEVVRKGDATKSTLTQAQVLAESSRRVVFVVGVDNAPVVLDNEYIPGRSRGTAYVYGVVERRVVCAANFDVQNAPEIKVEYMTSNYDVAGTGNKRAAAELKLKGELYVRVKNAIAANLHAVR